MKILQLQSFNPVQKKKTNVNKLENIKLNSLQKDTVSFGRGLNKKLVSSYKYSPGIGNVIFTNSLQCRNSVVLGNDVEVKGDIVSQQKNVKVGDNIFAFEIEAGEDVELGNGASVCRFVRSDDGSIVAKDNLKTRLIEAKGNIKLGSSAYIISSIESRNGSVEMNDNSFAEAVYASKNIKLGDNVTVGEVMLNGDIETGNNFSAESILTKGKANLGDNLRVKGEITSIDRGPITLGSIEELESIIFLKENKNQKNINGTLILTSEEINCENKIKLYLNENDSVEILTPTGSKTILDKFEFINSKTKKVIDSSEAQGIKLGKI